MWPAFSSGIGSMLRSYRGRRGYADPPWGIDLIVTDACDLRCAYCPIWGDDAAAPHPPAFMDTASAIRLLEDVSPSRPMIRLFGGEPFLHPDWEEIVGQARRWGLCCTAVSNGVRLAENAERIALSGLHALAVSLDTFGPVHDALRGRGTSARIRAGLRALREAKRRAVRDTPLVEIYTTVHEGTYSHLADWAAELGSWGIHRLRLQHLIWCSSRQLEASMGILGEVIPDPSFFGAEEQIYRRDEAFEIDGAVLVRQVEALKTGRYPFRVDCHPDLPLEDLPRYYADPEFQRPERPACTTMESYAFVDPRGRLYPCVTLDMGNVFEKPFLEVWNGRRLRAFRRLVRRRRRLPFCHRCPDS